MNFVNRWPSYELVCDNYLNFDQPSGKLLGKGVYMRREHIPLTFDSFLDGIIPYTGFYFIFKPFFLKAYLVQNELRYRSEYRFGEDSLFLAEILASGAKAAVLRTSGYIYTRRLWTSETRKTRQRSQLASAIELLRTQYASVVGGRGHRALRRRQYILRVAEVVERGIDHLGKRQYFAAFADVLGAPWAWPGILRIGFHRLRRVFWTVIDPVDRTRVPALVASVPGTPQRSCRTST